MVYREFQGLKISNLAFGAMRLPVIDGNDSKIDVPAAEKMVEYAMSHGVNYYDTAYGYHGGNSERVMGQILKKYDRSSFFLASKFPGYDLSNIARAESVFEEQLEKCGVDYFDFYLFHNVCEMNINEYLDEKYGLIDYLLKQKENGRIRHLGFSVHGSFDTFKRFLDAYGEHMEFCQIQFNYLDYKFQDAAAKVELLDELGIPVWVMEPLRGGRLVNLSAAQTEKLASLGLTPVEAAFRYLQSFDGVTAVLSGMSDMDQLAANIAIFEKDEPLGLAELGALYEIADEIIGSTSVPCTACRYCISHCPQELDIPRLISLYNEHVYTDGGFIAPMALMAVPEDKHPGACIGCRSCESVCPQQIKISEIMSDFAGRL